MDYFLPQLLNDLVYEAQAPAREFLEALSNPESDIDRFVAADSDSRHKFENERFYRFALMFETLTDKYDNAGRVDALLRAVDRGETGFVLWLRGFTFRLEYGPGGSMGWETDMEEPYRFDLAAKLSPAPFVLVRNPGVSESLVAQMAGAAPARENTYCVDLDDDWEADVRTLVDAASFIVVRNATMTEGIRTEIEFLRERRRLDDTYFSDPAGAKKLLGRRNVKALDDAAIVAMRDAAKSRKGPPASLSSPTRLWVQGEYRKSAAKEVLFVFDLFNAWARRGQGMPRDVQVRLLASAAAGSIALERLDLLAISLGAYAQTVGSYRDDELPHHATIAEKYFSIVQAVLRAIRALEDPAKHFECADLDRLKRLLNESEDPTQLTRTTTEVLRLMPERISLGGG